MSAAFIIFGLPRSRTYWLSVAMSHGGYQCAHEQMRHMRLQDDIKAWFSQDYTGAAETGAAPFWRTIRAVRPDLRVLVVRRPVAEVVDSLMALDMRRVCTFERGALTRQITYLDRKLDQIEARWPGVKSVSFAGLRYEAVFAGAYEFCTGQPHDHAWWASLADVNLQANMPALMRYMQANRPALDKLARQVAQHEKAAMWSRHHKPDPAGVTFQIEKIDECYEAARPLAREHMIATGQDVEDYEKKNWRLLRVLEKIGALQVATARCNGRLVAYLMSIIGPSLDDTTTRAVEHMPFCASQDFPGLGLKLMRVADDAATAKGAGVILARAGVRGAGPRLGILFKRLGYEPYGEMYRREVRIN